ncbi:hypothetical protein ACWEOZ_32835 [Actinoplanes sp. NPDC004185]
MFSELRDLQQDAAVLAGRLQAAQAAVVEAAGRDPSEQVRVVLDALGRIAYVDVEPSWRSRVGLGDLTAAALAAYQEAGRRRLETWAAEVNRPDAGSELHRSTPMPQADNQVTGSTIRPGSGPADEFSHESIRRLWYLLQDATDRLDDVVREAAARSQAVYTGRDPAGHVTASLTGTGDLTDLTLDEVWAEKAGNHEIGTALTAAIADGYAVVDERVRESTSQWPFPDLEQLSGSPTALLAALGLPSLAAEDDRGQE